MNKISVSTVTPVYKGEDYLEALIRAIDSVREKWNLQEVPLSITESIFVVDAAIDNSEKVLKQLAENYPWVRVVTLSRNFGQHSATAAGICHSTSEWIVTLDEDMQHDPDKILSLFENQCLSGSDVVYANPTGNIHGHRSWRDFSSKFTKSMISKLTQTPQVTMFNSFRLVRGSIARSAASSCSSQTYFDIALTWFTNRFSSIKIEMEDSRYVESKSSGYNLLSLIRHMRRLVISSNIDVASYGILTGLFAVFIGILTIIVAFIQKYFFPETIGSLGWASTVSLVTFFGGITITLICIVLEYASVVAINQLGKPVFFTVNRERDAYIKQYFEVES